MKYDRLTDCFELSPLERIILRYPDAIVPNNQAEQLVDDIMDRHDEFSDLYALQVADSYRPTSLAAPVNIAGLVLDGMLSVISEQAHISEGIAEAEYFANGD